MIQVISHEWFRTYMNFMRKWEFRTNAIIFYVCKFESIDFL